MELTIFNLEVKVKHKERESKFRTETILWYITWDI